MKKRWKTFARILLVSIPAALLALYLCAQLLVRSQWLLDQAEARIGSALGVKVRVGRLEAGLWGPLRAEQLGVEGALEDSEDFFAVPEAEIEYRWLDLLKGRLGRVTLVRPRLHLARDAQGRWNIPPNLLEESEKPAPIPSVNIDLGQVVIRTPDLSGQIDSIQLTLTQLPEQAERRRFRVLLQGRVVELDTPFQVIGQLWQEGKALGCKDVVLSASAIPAASVETWLVPGLFRKVKFNLEPADLHAQLNYEPSRVVVDWSLQTRGGAITSGTRCLAVDPLQMKGELSADLKRQQWQSSLSLAAGAWGRLNVDGEGLFQGDYPGRVDLRLEQAELEDLCSAFQDWLPRSVVPEGTFGLFLTATGPFKKHLEWSAKGALESPALRTSQQSRGERFKTALAPLVFGATGRAQIEPARLDVEDFDFTWGEGISARAQGSIASVTPTLDAFGQVEIHVADFAPFLQLARPWVSSSLIKRASGQMVVAATVEQRGTLAQGEVVLSLNDGQLDGVFGRLNQLEASCRIAAPMGKEIEAKLKASLGERLVSGFDGGPVPGKPVEFEGILLESTARLDDRQRFGGRFNVSARAIALPVTGEIRLPFHNASFAGGFEGDLAAASLALRGGRLAADGWPATDVTLTLAVNNPLSARVQIETGQLDLSELYATWEDSLPESYREWLVEGTGAIALEGKLRRDDDKMTLEGTAQVGLGGVNFFSADGLLAGNGLATETLVSASGEIDRMAVTTFAGLRTLDWDSHLTLKGQEVLYDAAYQDLSGLFLEVGSSGRWIPEGDRVEALEAGLTLNPVGQVRTRGTLEALRTAPKADLHIETDGLDLGAAHSRFFHKGGLKEYVPWMEKVESSGNVKGAVHLTGTMKDWSAEGRINVSEGLFGSKVDPVFIVSGFSLDLPFQVGSRKREAERTESSPFPEARLRYEQIVAGPLTFGGQELPFVLYNNDFRIPRDVSIPFYEGRLNVHELALEDFLSPDRGLLLDVQLRDVALEPIARDAELPPLTGTISAYLPRLETVGGDLLADSPAKFEIFGGIVDVSGLRVDRLFSSEPTLRFTSEFREIDLHQLTTVLQYGRASGMIEGHVHDFVGGPGRLEQMEAALQSVPRRGTPQRISVDLVETLASSGRGLGATEKAVLRQSEEYGYRRLGLRASVRQGRLYLEGTVPKGDKKYFMVGSLFGGIDIQLFPPEKGLAFKQYVEYLKRRLKQIKTGGGPKIEN